MFTEHAGLGILQSSPLLGGRRHGGKFAKPGVPLLCTPSSCVASGSPNPPRSPFLSCPCVSRLPCRCAVFNDIVMTAAN